VRAVDIRVNRANGVFDNPYPDFDPEALADSLKAASSRFHGTAGPEFVRQLLDQKITAKAITEKTDAFAAKALEGVNDASGQVKRVAQRFGLVAAAGELAVEFGLVPWKEGIPTADAVTLFKSWLSARGGAGRIEDEQIVEQARRIIESSAGARFEEMDPLETDLGDKIRLPEVRDRLGYRRGVGDARRWLVLPQAWTDEFCRGFDPRDVATVLAERGILQRAPDGRYSCVERIPNDNTRRWRTQKPYPLGSTS
jgi:putative DNA primase/helicase